jgi:hypothetical protein
MTVFSRWKERRRDGRVWKERGGTVDGRMQGIKVKGRKRWGIRTVVSNLVIPNAHLSNIGLLPKLLLGLGNGWLPVMNTLSKSRSVSIDHSEIHELA